MGTDVIDGPGLYSVGDGIFVEIVGRARWLGQSRWVGITGYPEEIGSADFFNDDGTCETAEWVVEERVK
jgi:hypothetical protein